MALQPFLCFDKLLAIPAQAIRRSTVLRGIGVVGALAVGAGPARQTPLLLLLRGHHELRDAARPPAGGKTGDGGQSGEGLSTEAQRPREREEDRRTAEPQNIEPQNR